MKRAKLFRNGQSQAVRLPKEFRFEGEEVQITKLGNGVLLLPTGHSWELLFESLGKFTDDFMEDRSQPASEDRADVFP
ncbi:MAG: antitoxin [Rhodothermia bacterium]